jgi:heme-degrading monooxygenase HmoA
MVEVLSAMSGFASTRAIVAEDGESLILVVFENEQTPLAWRDHSERRAVATSGFEQEAEVLDSVCYLLLSARSSRGDFS